MTEHNQTDATPITQQIAAIGEALLNLFSPNPQFVHRGRTYAVRRPGRRAIALLADIADGQPETPMVSLRPRIREVLRSTPPVLLTYIVAHSNHDTTLRLTIWMLGRTREHYATRNIFAHYDHPDPRVRREVVRALRRLSAWHELRQITQRCQYEETRHQAATHQSRPFDERLASFVRIAHQHPIPTSTHELVIAPGADTAHGREPRSGSQIRRVLRKIRYLMMQTRHRRRGLCGRLR